MSSREWLGTPLLISPRPTAPRDTFSGARLSLTTRARGKDTGQTLPMVDVLP